MGSSATIWHSLISNSSIRGTVRIITENHCVRMTGSCMHRWGILLSFLCVCVCVWEDGAYSYYYINSRLNALRLRLESCLNILKTSWIDMPATLGYDTASRSLQGYWPL